MAWAACVCPPNARIQPRGRRFAGLVGCNSLLGPPSAATSIEATSYLPRWRPEHRKFDRATRAPGGSAAEGHRGSSPAPPAPMMVGAFFDEGRAAAAASGAQRNRRLPAARPARPPGVSGLLLIEHLLQRQRRLWRVPECQNHQARCYFVVEVEDSVLVAVQDANAGRRRTWKHDAQLRVVGERRDTVEERSDNARGGGRASLCDEVADLRDPEHRALRPDQLGAHPR